MKRILIADDHDLIRRGVRMLVETRPNLQVVGEAAAGREAFATALDTRPDIAILDYSLPGLNGVDLTLKLKTQLPQTRVLMYTMHDREELVVDALLAGASGFVLKSDSERDLLAAVDALSVGRTYLSVSVSETLVERQKLGQLERLPGTLTHREREVVQLVAEGRINKEIAHVLSISIKTVETHRSTAMAKLGISKTADLVRYALRNNIVEP